MTKKKKAKSKKLAKKAKKVSSKKKVSKKAVSKKKATKKVAKKRTKIKVVKKATKKKSAKKLARKKVAKKVVRKKVAKKVAAKKVTKKARLKKLAKKIKKIVASKISSVEKVAASSAVAKKMQVPGRAVTGRKKRGKKEAREWALTEKSPVETSVEVEEFVDNGGDGEIGEIRPEEVILTDAEGRRYCRRRNCDQLASVEGYCRYHYLLFWKSIQQRKKILADGKLAHYIEELTSRYPDKYLEMIGRDLRTEKDFLAAIQEMEIDESAGDESSGFGEDSRIIDEVRGGVSETSPAREDEDY